MTKKEIYHYPLPKDLEMLQSKIVLNIGENMIKMDAHQLAKLNHWISSGSYSAAFGICFEILRLMTDSVEATQVEDIQMGEYTLPRMIRAIDDHDMLFPTLNLRQLDALRHWLDHRADIEGLPPVEEYVLHNRHQPESTLDYGNTKEDEPTDHPTE